MNKITIAIDGHSSCGKSTLAKDLAAKLGYVYVDTGAMYRALTLYCLQKKLINKKGIDKKTVTDSLGDIHISFYFNPEKKISETFLNGNNIEKEIRGMEVSKYVSEISKINEIRNKLVRTQRELGKNKGVVIEGRDIGSVVFPDAELKFFMTADIDVRAKRRYEELIAKGIKTTLNEIKDNLKKRDFEDTHRKDSPLVKAKDAVVLDSTGMSCEKQLQYAMQLVEDILR